MCALPWSVVFVGSAQQGVTTHLTGILPHIAKAKSDGFCVTENKFFVMCCGCVYTRYLPCRYTVASRICYNSNRCEIIVVSIQCKLMKPVKAIQWYWKWKYTRYVSIIHYFLIPCVLIISTLELLFPSHPCTHSCITILYNCCTMCMHIIIQDSLP